MASSAFVNIRTTRLNDPNVFTLTYDQQALFTFCLSEQEMQELVNRVMKFACDIFEERHGNTAATGDAEVRDDGPHVLG